MRKFTKIIAVALSMAALSASPGFAQQYVYPIGVNGTTGWSVTNPGPIRLTDGTNNISATVPLAVQLSQSNAAASLSNPVPMRISADGTNAMDATHGLYANLLQSNAVVSSTNPVPARLTNGTSNISATAPLFTQLTDGTNANDATHGSYMNLLQSNAVVSSTNPVPARLTNGTSNISATAPLAVQASVGNVAASQTNGVPVILTNNTGYNSASAPLAAQLSQGNAAISATNPLFTNISVGSAAISATNGLFSNLLQGNSAISATNPLFTNLSVGSTAVALNNPVPVRISVDGTNGSSATNPLNAALNGKTAGTIASLTNGVPVEQVNSTQATYRTVFASFTPYATPTDVITIPGNATTVTRVRKIVISGIQTTAGINDWLLVKRAAANTGGTSSAGTAVPTDSSSSAAQSVPKKWTAAPTINNTVGSVADEYVPSPAATSVVGAAKTVIYDADNMNCEPITLRGTAQELALNFAGAAVPAGMAITVEVETTESAN